jgi:hypothetical protein
MFKAVNRGTQKFRVLEYLNKFPNASNKEIAEALNIPLNSARGRKSDLDKEGFLDTEKEKGKTVKAVATEKAKTEFPELTDDDFARDDFIDDDDVWYKKILKTGETKNPKWKTSTDIEAVTFEKLDCNTNRFQDMLDSITDNIMEISYIDKAGYDCERIGADFIDEQAQYPNIRVTFTNAGGVTTKYIP